MAWIARFGTNLMKNNDPRQRQSLQQVIAEQFFLGMAIVFGCLTIALGIFFFGDLWCLFQSGLTSWDDARGLGFFIGGTIAPFVTFMGLHLSSQRVQGQDRQTEEMQKQNLATERGSSFTLLAQALDLVDQQAEAKRIAGLALLRQPKFQKDFALIEPALAALTAFSELHSASKQTTELSLNWNRLEASEALKSFLYLSGVRDQQNSYQGSFARLTDVDFSKILIDGFSVEAGAEIQSCDFRQSQFIDVEVDGVLFIKCDLTNARFVGVEFHQVGFIDCDISGLVANLDTDIDYSSLFSGCKYLLDRHPFLPLGTELPIPDILETDEPGTI